MIHAAKYKDIEPYQHSYRNFRTSYKSWSISSGGGGGGAVKYSNRWWFWTREGRQLWKQCKEKTDKSPFWAENQCSTRIQPAKGSKYWWWTSTGRSVWKECKEKGETSPFWKDNDCAGGRSGLAYRSLRKIFVEFCHCKPICSS